MTPSAASMMACKCRASSGPGSSTVISPRPNKYVLVPGPVIRPALGATMRRTAVPNTEGLPGMRCDRGSNDPRRHLHGRNPHYDNFISPGTTSQQHTPGFSDGFVRVCDLHLSSIQLR